MPIINGFRLVQVEVKKDQGAGSNPSLLTLRNMTDVVRVSYEGSFDDLTDEVINGLLVKALSKLPPGLAKENVR